FFQAEDGIRDRNVTGVQTCALPISNAVVVGIDEQLEQAARIERAVAERARCRDEAAQVTRRQRPEIDERLRLVVAPDGVDAGIRSEERRVGKECRGSGWVE